MESDGLFPKELLLNAYFIPGTETVGIFHKVFETLGEDFPN